MKKTMILLLALLLCLPVSGLAVDESQFVGTWIQETYDEETGRYSYELLRLTADHQAYYSVQSFEPGKEGFSRQSAKTWSIKGNGIHIVLGNNSDTDAVILSDGRLGFKLTGDSYSPFVRINDKKEETARTLEMLKTGVTIPQGEYYIDEDIPAGRYVADAGSARLITLWIYDAKGWSNYYYIGSSKNEQIMIMNLEKGGKLRVDDASVIIREYTGLFQ